MSDIPLARRKLDALASRLHSKQQYGAAVEIREICQELLTRASPVRRAPIDSRKLTPQLAEEIREYVAANPDLSQQEVGVHFGVNHGRVSEALHAD